jgi:hypothetical protein
MAIAIPVRRAASVAGWRVVVSAAAMAPGPILARGRGFHSREAYSSPSRPTPNPSAYTSASPAKWLQAASPALASVMASSTGSVAWPRMSRS